ncbi:hypothetical protein COW53_01375 [bacterium CG17_big_fil_post_rev_8_21_14_2_50_64_8]|nr:MAG: hypothetical protein COW53_01375 [bacterium CG17_big_fil_post_rev_8_21_14_2_50_64_8]PJA74719.1 MAG: hypothetical protein CO151_09010 [bacterium CG_4_9_14_3_um_filter_65_15]
MARFGNLPLALLAALTVALVVMMQVAAGGGGEGQANGLLTVLALPVPLGLSVLWGWAWLVFRSGRHVVLAAAIALVTAVIIRPGPMVGQAAANMAAGVAAGWALGVRLRPDAALVLCAGILVPMLAWSVHEVPVAEQMDMLRQDMTGLMESRIPSTATPEQHRQAMAKEMEELDVVLDAAAGIYPAMIALGLLAQAGMILGLVWFVARLTGGLTASLRFGSFSRLQVPFYTVWLLIIGLGMMLTRTDPARTIGLNLSLLAGLILSVQGVAVQIAVIGRVLSPLGRMVFWLVMGVFFAPLVVAAGVLLGLADQWLDFRRLAHPETEDEEKVV